MEDLADLLADEDTVLRGYIAVSKVKILGHKYMGPDRTVSISYTHNSDPANPDDILWCLVEKERGKAPLIYPVVSKPDED